MAVLNWQALRHRVDEIVDNQFSDHIELHPWLVGSYSGPGGPDTSRNVVRTVAIFVRPGANITGEGGTMGGGLSSRMLEGAMWLSITEDNLGDPTRWHKGDRVLLRSKWYEIEHIELSALYRPNLYLIPLNDNVFAILYAQSLEVGSPQMGSPAVEIPT